MKTVTAEATTMWTHYSTITIFDRCHNYIQTKAAALMKLGWRVGGAKVVISNAEAIVAAASSQLTLLLQTIGFRQIFTIYSQVVVLFLCP